ASPNLVERVLRGTATAKACPVPAEYTYEYYRLVNGEWVLTTRTATCEGTKESNGFYGNGIINALSAVK
ncbi:peptidase S8, partial [Actinomadura adrarensis]